MPPPYTANVIFGAPHNAYMGCLMNNNLIILDHAKYKKFPIGII